MKAARTRLVAVAFAASMACSAHAGIVDHPASIVDHGSYITDTIHQLEWYKFSNAATTIGLSYDAAVATFASGGWAAASIDQVLGLESAFGWTADTLGQGSNANFGLTDAMAGYLGYTGIFYSDQRTVSYEVWQIAALTSDAFFFDGDDHQYQLATMSYSVLQTTPADGSFYYGDYVNSQNDAAIGSEVDDSVGVWLSRSVTAPVPEPGTWALLLAGLGLVGRLSRSRARGASD